MFVFEESMSMQRHDSKTNGMVTIALGVMILIAAAMTANARIKILPSDPVLLTTVGSAISACMNETGGARLFGCEGRHGARMAPGSARFVPARIND